MAGRPKGATKTVAATARTVHIEEDDWERIMTVAFMSKPRRSASDVVREMIAAELPEFETDLAKAAKKASTDGK